MNQGTYDPAVIYASRKLLQVTVHILEAVHISEHMNSRRNIGGTLSFRSFGGVSGAIMINMKSSADWAHQPFYIPKDAYDVTPLVKTIAVCTEKGIMILDPTKYVSLSTVSL